MWTSKPICGFVYTKCIHDVDNSLGLREEM